MYRDIEPAPSRQRTGPGAGRSVIAVIGIDQYVSWPRLSNAVSDAEAAAQLFEQLGFDQVGPVPLAAKLERGKAYKARVTAQGYAPIEIDVSGGVPKQMARLVAKPGS